MKAHPAPPVSRVVLLLVAGAVFASAAAIVDAADWSLRAAPVHAIQLAIGLVGAGLLLLGVRDLLDVLRAARAHALITATVLEVRREVAVNRQSQGTHWTVVATGRWPDGRPCDFQSKAIRRDPRDRIAPGQSVLVRGDPWSGVYAMDLATVAGDASDPAALRPHPSGGPVPQPKERSGAGLKIGAATLVLGLGLAAAAQGRGTATAAGLALAGVGLLIVALSSAARRADRRLTRDGVVFPVRIVRITHTVMHGRAPADRWSVTAEGSWPDGFNQQFRGEAPTGLGDLREGATVWVQGDPRTRIYALKLGEADGPPQGLKQP